MAKKKKKQLQLTKKELEHLRDLMNVHLLDDDHTRVSEKLAGFEDRTTAENKLWVKVYDLCVESGIAVEDDAPDHALFVDNNVFIADVFASDVNEEEGDEDEDDV